MLEIRYMAEFPPTRHLFAAVLPHVIFLRPRICDFAEFDAGNQVHGRVSPHFYHTSSFCGRAYVISRSLMLETLKHAEGAFKEVPHDLLVL